MKLTEDTEWIGPCSAVEDKHMHVSVHLIEGDDGWILVDTGSRVHREYIADRLEAATDGAGPDAVLLTHTDFPHTGNVAWLLKRWPDVDIYVGTSNPEGQNLPADSYQSSTGETQDIYGRDFHFIDPPLADRSLTNWVVDREADILYTSDGFGYHHVPGECRATSRELSDALSVEAIRTYHEVSLPWIRYVDPALIMASLETIFEPYTLSWLASTHGPPIAGEDLDGYLDRFEAAVKRITADYAP